MLADAGILQLDLQLRLLKHGYSLKDATAFNVAFDGAHPVFIDIPSIEIPRRLDVWVAYGQFCRMFVFPLLLHHLRGMDFKQCFLGEINGPSVESTRRMLGLTGALRPAAFVDVFLQHLLHVSAGKGENKQDPAKFNAKVSDDPRPQELNLLRLRSKLQSIRKKSCAKSLWSSYEKTKSYDQPGDAAKTAFVKEALAECGAQSVYDAGCNTGRYSQLAAATGARVIAADADLDCVDVLYRSAQKDKLDILPLSLDITNPSPALGFRHAERKSFEQRADFDCVMALALIHHLLVAARVPLPAMRDMFAALTSKWLIVEFVQPHDSMFLRLLATRENLYEDLTPELFEEVFGNVFEIVRRQEIMNGHRVLYLMRRRAPPHAG